MEKKFEKCVVCGKETNVEVSQHIDERSYYIEGVGQLCKACFDSIYGKGE